MWFTHNPNYITKAIALLRRALLGLFRSCEQGNPKYGVTLLIFCMLHVYTHAQTPWSIVGQDNDTRAGNTLARFIHGKIWVPSFTRNLGSITPFAQISLTRYSLDGMILKDTLYGNADVSYQIFKSCYTNTFTEGVFTCSVVIRNAWLNTQRWAFIAIDTLGNMPLVHESSYNADTTLAFIPNTCVIKQGNAYLTANSLSNTIAYQNQQNEYSAWSVLQRLDAQGNVLATRTIGHGPGDQAYQYRCNRVHFYEGHYYALINKMNWQLWQTMPSNLVMYKLDTLLNVVDSFATSDGNWYGSNTSAVFPNGDFVVGGTNVYLRVGEDFWQRKYIRKFDKNLNPIWTCYVGKRSLNTRVSKLMVTSTGEVAGVGTDGIVSIGLSGDSIGHITGCVFKLTGNGDSLWLHNYQAIDSPIFGDVNTLNDLDELPDGGFVAAGYCDETNNPNLTRGWLIRTDANGCLNADCTSSAREIEGLNQPLVYPNPCQAQLYAAEPQQVASYALYQSSGNLLARGNSFPISMAPYPRGLYLLHITTKQGYTMSQRFVKE